jgi:hypothetical protein
VPEFTIVIGLVTCPAFWSQVRGLIIKVRPRLPTLRRKERPRNTDGTGTTAFDPRFRSLLNTLESVEVAEVAAIGGV